MKLHVTAFALTCGIHWGLGLFLLTLVGDRAGWGQQRGDHHCPTLSRL